jgi:multiple sugar transport system permease protein
MSDKASTGTTGTLRGRHRRINSLAAYIIVSIVAIMIIIPLIWLIGASLKTLPEISTFAWFPRVPQWRNYIDGLTEMNFARYFFNSIYITVINVVGGSLVAAMAGYAFGRLRFPGRNFLFGLVLSTMMLPFAAIMIPSFVVFRTLRWIDTYTVMTVPFILAVPAFYIFLMRQYFLTIPRELDDAAKMDACGYYRIFWSILLPLCKPALTTVAIYVFMANWGNLIRAVLFLNSANMRTVPVGLALLNLQLEEPALKVHLMLSNSVLYIVPPLIIFIVFQKYFTKFGSELSTMTAK